MDWFYELDAAASTKERPEKKKIFSPRMRRKKKKQKIGLLSPPLYQI